uniref:Uncharacterized protein n=1 Tax=Oryza meridionalis TaxID=40149 RepID=A0A0E0CU97_9ORYZ
MRGTSVRESDLPFLFTPNMKDQNSSSSLPQPPSPEQQVSITMHSGSRTPFSLTRASSSSEPGKSASQTAARWCSPASAALPSAWRPARATSGESEGEERAEETTAAGPERRTKVPWLRSSPARRLRRRRRRRSRRRWVEAGRRWRVSARASESAARPWALREASRSASRVSSSSISASHIFSSAPLRFRRRRREEETAVAGMEWMPCRGGLGRRRRINVEHPI